eukprot:g3283.t1
MLHINKRTFASGSKNSIKKILIANRGEIAIRVMQTAKRLGIKTVAVYSDVDRHADHVAYADEAYSLGGTTSAESYLQIPKIMEAIKATGADAVHPGYGFLSENAEFSKTLKDNNIEFIGPNEYAINSMGDKIESMRIAEQAGVSCAKRFDGEVDTAEHALEIASGIGYPIIMKASAGGGGKGMRIAWTEDELKEGFYLAKTEAAASFGDDRMLIQQFVCPYESRHIEIQVIGDKHGNYAAFPERECSIQRRNQKVLEESPSTLLSPETRKKMQEQAILLCKSVGYFFMGAAAPFMLLGGVTLAASNVEEKRKGFYISILNGCYDASAIVWQIYVWLDSSFENGLSYSMWFLIYVGLNVLLLISILFIVPGNFLQHDGNENDSDTNVKASGIELTDLQQTKPTKVEDQIKEESENTEVNVALPDQPLFSQLKSTEFIVFAVFFCVGLLRFSYYIGSIDAQLTWLGQVNGNYSIIFGSILPFGIFSTPFIGMLIDSKGLISGFVVIYFFKFLHSILTMVPNLNVQIAGMVCFAIFRGCFFATCSAYLIDTFGLKMGKVFGAAATVGAISSLSQSALLALSLSVNSFLPSNLIILGLTISVCLLHGWYFNAHPYATESNRTDISISSAEKPGEILYYVDTTVTNAQQKRIPKLKKLTDADNIVCCRDLLLNETVVNNHIFSATAKKLRKFKGCHDSACENGRPPSSIEKTC